MGKKISVLIPVINEEKKIERCLQAVFEQTMKPLEVIVIDGHSTDNTIEKARKFDVKILFEDYHTRAGACQIGLENAKGDFVAFTDADCIPERNWLMNLIQEFDEGIVGVGGGIKNIGESNWEKSINLATNTFLGSARSVQGRLFNDKRYVFSISGCNSVYRKDDLLKVGGFNVSLSTAEDTDLNRKLLKIGNLLYTPCAIVLHNHKRGLNAFGKRMYQYGYGRGRSKIWDIQVAPPIIIPIIIISLIFTPWIFLVSAGSYLTILLIFGLNFALKEKNLIYLASIPIVYLIEHALYAIGLWKGLLNIKG
ncbi:MAG: glycosyltransferase [Caldisericales bacterium]|nr:glycosyltransferase [Caldisericales bacterium]